jgi:hypothetical protein
VLGRLQSPMFFDEQFESVPASAGQPLLGEHDIRV